MVFKYRSVSLCMRNSEITKNKVLKESIKLFNTKGYKTTSLSDITLATGFTKGAIYRHFENKEDLEIDAFETIMKKVFAVMHEKISENKNTKDKLFSVLDLFQSYISNPFIVGGCPLLNVAIEFDNTDSKLKLKGQKALETIRETLKIIIQNGKKHNQVKLDVNEGVFATIFIATIEGGIMMSNLKNNNKDILIIVNHLKHWIETTILS